jgi:hypothetical protein
LISIFDIYSVSLLVVSLIQFVVRYVRQEPPVMPYFVIACVCAVGNWLGEMGGGWAAWALLVAASFLFLSCVMLPHHREMQKNRAEKAETQSASKTS